MIFKTLLTIPLFVIALIGFSTDLQLYINPVLQEIEGLEYTLCSFNSSDIPNSKNEVIRLGLDEELNLTITNLDDLPHNLFIDDILEDGAIIQAGQTETFTISFDSEGTWRYYSSYSYGDLLGASGIILVGYESFPTFYWNLLDIDGELSNEIADEMVTEIPSDYAPELFFINGARYPNTLEDPQTLVSLNLGETGIISVVNSGYMDHVLHFHGFHIEILSAQIQSDRVGWIKDSIPIKSGEAMTFRLVANQVGMYPVHDHNLIAVTNVGTYPGGMLTQIQVQP
jgi:hypothetical protein